MPPARTATTASPSFPAPRSISDTAFAPEGELKDIQVVDGALNCTFRIFQTADEEFALLFPEPQQDIQCAENLINLPRQEEVEAALRRIWERPALRSGDRGCFREEYRDVKCISRSEAVELTATRLACRRRLRAVCGQGSLCDPATEDAFATGDEISVAKRPAVIAGRVLFLAKAWEMHFASLYSF
ncbi:MAG: hypothetical protein ACREHF_08495 [Rhizomicrobium sp.]